MLLRVLFPDAMNYLELQWEMSGSAAPWPSLGLPAFPLPLVFQQSPLPEDCQAVELGWKP